jgi:hypothetical protein
MEMSNATTQRATIALGCLIIVFAIRSNTLMSLQWSLSLRVFQWCFDKPFHRYSCRSYVKPLLRHITAR